MPRAAAYRRQRQSFWTRSSASCSRRVDDYLDLPARSPLSRSPTDIAVLQDAFAILGSWGAIEDADGGANATSVITTLSFWDYSLLTKARMAAFDPLTITMLYET